MFPKMSKREVTPEMTPKANHLLVTNQSIIVRTLQIESPAVRPEALEG
jgi:hypothetical protein